MNIPSPRKLVTALGLAAGLALGLAAPSHAGGSCGDHAKASAGKDLVDTAVAAGSFQTLAKALQAADLVGTLKGDGPFTVFAPTDAAFARLPEGALAGLLADKAALRKVLTYHVVAGRVPAKKVVGMDFAETVQGAAARIRATSDGVRIDDAKVIKTDIEASNGIIHVIDRVILPRKDIVGTAIEAGSFTTLVQAVQAAGLVEALQGKGPFTVFAPSDAAFGRLPAGTVEQLVADKPLLADILKYHVISGRVLSSDLEVGTVQVPTLAGRKVTVTKRRDGSVLVDGAKVTSADVLAANGVIHVIDRVITPKDPQ